MNLKTNDENKPISTEIIWNNSHIKILDKTFFLKKIGLQKASNT